MRLAGGCALLLGVSLSGCAAPQYTDVSDPGANIHFGVPNGWHQISGSSLASQMGFAPGGVWMVGYEAGPEPKAADFLSFGTAQPFVAAWSGTLSSALSHQMSNQTLRDFFLPVTPTARQNAVAQGFRATGFRHLEDKTLTLSQGVHGVRETYDYTAPGGSSINVLGDSSSGAYTPVGETDTFDTEALTNAGQTVVFLLVVHCTTVCYSKYRAEIEHLMSSVTVSGSGSPKPSTG